MEANYFTILYWFCHTSTWIHQGCTRVPNPEPHLPPPSPYHPSGSSPCTSHKHPVSCNKPGLAIRFTCDNLRVSMPFSHIIPPSPSPTESKRLFCTSVSLLLSHIQGYRYHLYKFHLYVLVYCIGIFLSGLLHSVYFLQSFPGGSAVKNLSANSGKASSILASGKSPGEGNGKPLQYSYMENSMDTTIHRATKSRTQLSD